MQQCFYNILLIRRELSVKIKRRFLYWRSFGWRVKQNMSRWAEVIRRACFFFFFFYFSFKHFFVVYTPSSWLPVRAVSSASAFELQLKGGTSVWTRNSLQEALQWKRDDPETDLRACTCVAGCAGFACLWAGASMRVQVCVLRCREGSWCRVIRTICNSSSGKTEKRNRRVFEMCVSFWFGRSHNFVWARCIK